MVMLAQQFDLQVTPIRNGGRTIVFDWISSISHILQRDMFQMKRRPDAHYRCPKVDGTIEVLRHECQLPDRAAERR